MIKKIFLENFYTFSNRIELILEKDNYTKKFYTNTQNNILKTAVIYGPNNTGKTKLIEGVKAIKDVILNNKSIIVPNFFLKNQISKLGINFIYKNKNYQYEFWVKYGLEFVYEKFSEITTNKEKVLFLKDTINKKYLCETNVELQNSLQNTSNNNILIYTLNTDNFKILKEIKNTLLNTAQKIEVLNMNSINDNKTIELLKNKNNISKRIVEFIKNADLFLNDYYYDDEAKIFTESISDIKEFDIHNTHQLDKLKMVSVYNGVSVPSFLFDSLGTKKIVALSSYIIESLDEGKYLFIDELDSSLHFKLTRAIISMFHSNLNEKAQLICTLHDISLLDIKNLFRKDQIWFTDKTENGTTLFSLKDFSYDDTGIRDTSDLQEKYKKGILGAIPEPDLIETLLDNQNE